MKLRMIFQIVILAIVLYISPHIVMLLLSFFLDGYSHNTLKQVCLAVHQYHEQWDVIPPHEWQNEKGVRLSYRVLLMPYFKSDVAKSVAMLSTSVSSIQELESSQAYRQWRRSAEGQLFFERHIEFIPVIGPWPSWGEAYSASKPMGWNGNRIPLVLAIGVNRSPRWCEPSPPASVRGSQFVVESGCKGGKVVYFCKGCEIEIGSAVVVEKPK